MVHDHDDVPDPDWQEKAKKAGAIAGKARAHGATLLREGARLLDVAEEIEAFIRKEGAQPAFPVNLSINHDAAHDSPRPKDPRTFAPGDLVKLDVGAHVDGYIGDTAVTVEIGTQRHARLIEASREAMLAAVSPM